jgi:16S rRNA (uracil1498-N3)-methyltransferase
MRLSRIHTKLGLAVAETVTLDEAASHYLVRVLRIAAGDLVVLFNGDGIDYTGEIVDLHHKGVAVRLSGCRSPANESSLKITLVQALSRGERMDYCLQKATELGVVCVQPLLSRRVEVRLNGKREAKRLAHWKAVVVSACEQSGRAVVPEVFPPLGLAQWLTGESDGQRLVLDPEAKTKLTDIRLENDSTAILVGPEGGFTNEELGQAKASGVTAVSLGPRVLRTESAGPAAIAVLQSMAGDF